MIPRALISALLSFVLSASVFAAEIPRDKEINTGEDITHPPSTFDIRYKYQLLNEERSQNTFTLRTDRASFFNKSWGLGTRFDLPCVLTNSFSAHEPDGALKFGLGDFLAQALLLKKFGGNWAAGAGTQFIFPTATGDQMGGGKYQLLPTAGVRRKLPGLSEGSFAEMTVRYALDYAGSKKRGHIGTLEMAPSVNWMLPGRWFINTYPSNDIQINLLDGGHVFLPFNAMIGKIFPGKTILSVEFGFPMFYSGKPENFYTFYEYKMEARVGFFY
ncbi:MAG: hypothetical protein A2351_06625 [Omnitrophica bacterium RIFOXYB12_FULL_50_7]|nr:MAG: hypothetical protein A2351_06625 [Omnitrophica bacterium RIFOXYB12_FULL_50_7]